ncbi:MMPL family transporter [Aquibacillus sp. 3ASR75-11]|uniref:MMPL family transporter n=1 Tax=Terrihalobacillus insolitus TaxID=2950438 RepID=A0A9X3WRB2_9BACI|nr:MMPL family transporter [Terrihalobacillus insolitus]MDC3413611.1 MMPL family transporter [Terrihalobacillus insolitus]MDC3424632.1 MMPL family transporter [Terrihalobacillus insolitus]
MRKIIQLRWPIAILWVIVAVSLLLLSPNLAELVREKGQIGVPNGYPSTQAEELLDRMESDNTGNTTSGVLVFHNDDGLTDVEKEEVNNAITLLKNNKEKLGLSNILAYTDDPAIEEQTVSDDGKTILVPTDISLQDRTIAESREDIYAALESIKVDHLLTGESYISEDIIINSEEGLKKTEYITVGFILLILFVVFRSLIAPFVPLLTVGISYLAAQGIVAILADTADFPLSTFTQIFMVAIMFGIGTDYCILLINRFKEELSNHETTKDAVLATYKSGGKTVFFAGLAVLIGFSTIGLSTFSLYQSAVAVAVGVAVVLLALVTLVPFFLVILGKKLFWPFDKNVAHSESKLWGSVGSFALTRPLIALAIIAAVVLPSILSYDGNKSYNSLEEIGDEYGSVEAFNWISNSFGPGQTMPATVVFDTREKIDSVQEFEAIEAISQKLARLDGVEQVRSATRPAGEILEDFTVTSQTNQLGEGISESTDGIDEIQTGLADASEQLNASQPQLKEAENGVDQLLTGTQQANNGIGEMKTALSDIQTGIASSSSGAGQIKDNLETIQTKLQETINANNELLAGYQGVESGLKPLLSGYQFMPQLLSSALDNLEAAEDNNAELEQDEDFQEAKAQVSAAINGSEGQPGLNGLNQSLETQVLPGLTKANQGFQQTIDGQEQLAQGLDELIAAITKLENGLNQAANGQQQVVNSIPSLQAGLNQLYGGQEELKTAFSDMQKQLSQLSSGLTDSSDGLKQISTGLSQVEDYLGEFSSEGELTSVNIPQKALENEAFQEGIQPYLSDDETITTFDVVLSYNPYSTEAVNTIDTISETLTDALDDTPFDDSNFAIGGISSTNNDLQNISDADYTRTVFLMLGGIFVILILLLRSITMPIYLIGSLVLTYFTSMGIAEFIFVNLLGYDGLSWAVPFFAFVILVALGIDYSIFLMDRFNEYNKMDIKEALLSAMRNMGTVIISAAIILGGTFAAMLPSGVLSLLEIATVVLTGLFLYALIMLPLFIPVMVRIFGKANWWPFSRKTK